MAGRLKKIVDYVAQQATLKNLALATLSLQVKEDVLKVDENTPDDLGREARYLEAARKVLRRQELDIRF